jgi:hypothetical protein
VYHPNHQLLSGQPLERPLSVLTDRQTTGVSIHCITSFLAISPLLSSCLPLFTNSCGQVCRSEHTFSSAIPIVNETPPRLEEEVRAGSEGGGGGGAFLRLGTRELVHTKEAKSKRRRASPT